ncbi:MAG: SUMF1/EgtB/PvdO family nonheme iron enzyme [Thermoguttaceae bacterium]|nr:SUMF1/EgtB/PvdO family nonheme iron enzyme [Thermoguttaceae bacterium]
MSKTHPILCGMISCAVLAGGAVLAQADEVRPWQVNSIEWFSKITKAAPVENADAATEDEMKPYTEKIAGTDITFDMVPIKSGSFMMGATEEELEEYGVEADEYMGIDNAAETPQREVKVDAFWMGKCEVTWKEYEAWSARLEKQIRESNNFQDTELETLADGIVRPTPPYTDMTFDMGKDNCPAIAMSVYAAQMYCKWLTAKTGRYYRLPTEAEWEYACRAGSDTPYSFGDEDIDDYAWYYDNAEDKYQQVGQKKPNAWGLYDMHGNVREWCLDQYLVDGYADAGNENPLVSKEGRKRYPTVARGGSWYDDAENLRSAVRFGSNKSWNQDDPQIPKSIWYEASAKEVGFRVVRPLAVPTADQAAAFEPDPEEAVKYGKLNARQQN